MRYGSVALLLLDSNFGELEDPEIAEQCGWYRSQLQACEEDPSVEAVIACAHHPPFTRSTVVSPDAKVRALFAEPFLRKGKTRIFFSGHAHSYERFEVKGKQFVVSGGGGGPRHALKEGGETTPRDEFHGGPIREFHFCRVRVRGSTLELEMVRLEEPGRAWSVGDRVRVTCR